MAKTVQLSEEAYATLAALKRAGESFSDVVRRLAAERKDPRALKNLGGLRPDFEEILEKMRQADIRKMKRLRE